jgi:hypothetical protein
MTMGNTSVTVPGLGGPASGPSNSIFQFPEHETCFNNTLRGIQPFSSVPPSNNSHSQTTIEQVFVGELEPSFPPGAIMMTEDFAAWIFESEQDHGTYGIDAPDTNLRVQEANGELLNSELLHLQHISSLWFTNVWGPSSGTSPQSALEVAPAKSHDTKVDDRYRQTIQKGLEIAPYKLTVPSADILNMYIRLYFNKTHPVFPIVHPATFKPCKERANVLLSMCALGALHIGTDQGLQHGLEFFERIQKAAFHNLDTTMCKGREMMIMVIHCASLGLVFGMLSGSPITLINVDAFRGIPIALARSLKMHQSVAEALINLNANGLQLENQWRNWAYQQEVIRIMHALLIVDAELSSILHHEPIQSLESYSFVPTCSDSIFAASNSIDWKDKYLAGVDQQSNQGLALDFRALLSDPQGLNQIPTNSRFTAYAVLEGISMRVISACRSSTKQIPRPRKFDHLLTTFYTRFLDRRKPQPRHDNFQLDILWHVVYMETCCDFDLLEKAIGREGSRLTSAELSNTIAWATSEDAHRCLLHAFMIANHVQAMSVGLEVAIHVPRALFWAGLAVLCSIKFGPKSKSSQHGSAVNFPEFLLPGLDQSIGGVDIFQHDIGDDFSQHALLLSIIDLLDRVGHWKLSRQFAIILRAGLSISFGQ